MDEQIKEKLSYLRLNGLLNNWDHYLKRARESEYSHTRFLKYVIEQEYTIKKENATKLRMQRAKIPQHLVFETFPFDRQPNLNKKNITEIYDSFEYITRQQNMIFIGTTGTGKTGLATAFLIQAIHRGLSGRFILFSDLIELLFQSMADGTQNKVIKQFASFDCLLVDEIGYIETEPAQVGLFFSLMHKRYQNKTTLISSNLSFSKWNTFFKNDQLSAALIDRLTENSHVINMRNCVSLREKLAVK
jgi:DNA replication protein DnaC